MKKNLAVKTEVKVLTNSEEKLWKALKNHTSVKEAANAIGISPKTAYNMLNRLRKKYTKYRRFVNFVDGQKKSRIIKLVMTSRMTVNEEIDETEDDENVE